MLPCWILHRPWQAGRGQLTIAPGVGKIKRDELPAPVAQGIEQRFPKPRVAGSNPAGGAWAIPSARHEGVPHSSRLRSEEPAPPGAAPFGTKACLTPRDSDRGRSFMFGGRPRFWVTLIILFLVLIPAGLGQWDLVIAILLGLVVANGLAFMREK